jgi:dTDP-4-dehydrorhamnose 3,5-epimerase
MMVFHDTALQGAHVIEPDYVRDDRGFFAPLWSTGDFAARGLVCRFEHCSIAFNRLKGTLRGLHYQMPPFAETKLVRCTRGAIHDVVVDLRPDSPSFRRWIAVELTASNRRTLYIPAGCAHGYQTLTRDAEVHYMIDAPYSPAHGRGVRWNDPAFRIEWPDGERTMNDRDASYPDFTG